MSRKLLIVGLIVALGFSLCSCSLFGKDKKKGNGNSEGTKNAEVKKYETGGLYYLFDKKNYDATEFVLGDLAYSGPNFASIVRGNANAYLQASDKHVLFIWFNQKGTETVAADVITNSSAGIIQDIAADIGIKDKGCNFIIDKSNTETVNDISRSSITGTMMCHSAKDDSEMELKYAAYSFVLNGKPGCVLDVVTDKKQADKYLDEAKHNVEVMMNTIVSK